MFNKDTGDYDFNEDLRNELERDAKRFAQRFDHVNGILVTGDVAFSGKPEEYQIARQWLERLSGFLGSPNQNIWTIPGNHDVFRPAIDASLNLQNMHKSLRDVPIDRANAVLAKYLSHLDGDLLFQPLVNYNSFATPYGCISSRIQPMWEHDIELNDGSFLRLAGLNSTLISNIADDQQANRLLLGERQFKRPNYEGVTYLMMCHHPADWLRDGDLATDSLIKRTAIQLFGHKHAYRHRKITEPTAESLVIAAGAVHPSRAESDWQPRYNFISLSVITQDNERKLEVKVWPRVFTQDLRFDADYAQGGIDHHITHISLEAWDGKTLPERRSVHETLLSPVLGTSHHPTTRQNEEATMENERLLVYRFFSLSYPQIIRIAVDLNLLKPEDRSILETELLNRLYTRAKQGDMLADLWKRVDEVHPDGRSTINPFAQKNG